MKDNPVTAVLETLGQKIIELTDALENERWFRRSADEKAARLEAENETLLQKLDAVKDYIKKMEGAENE